MQCGKPRPWSPQRTSRPHRVDLDLSTAEQTQLHKIVAAAP
jgi:hypothetical protein